MRRLSHRLNSKMVGQSAIGDLLRDLCEDMEQLSRLKISLEIEEMAPVNDPNTSLHLYRIAQELLTNAAKYLKNGVVILHIIIEEKRVLISYSDSGPGFNTNVKHEGMGIMNIYERVKLLNGEGILISSEEKGTSWEISFPNR
jgi:signal transduction histidine kinase